MISAIRAYCAREGNHVTDLILAVGAVALAIAFALGA